MTFHPQMPVATCGTLGSLGVGADQLHLLSIRLTGKEQPWVYGPVDHTSQDLFEVFVNLQDSLLEDKPNFSCEKTVLSGWR